jgi:hypothetical protein
VDFLEIRLAGNEWVREWTSPLHCWRQINEDGGGGARVLSYG